jgi:hypothetical protein
MFQFIILITYIPIGKKLKQKFKNLCIFFYTDNIPISIIKQEFTIYLRNLLNQQQVFTIKDKIKEVSFKISLYEKTGNKQGIWGGILPKSSSQIELI